MMYSNYEIKLKENQDKWNDECENVYNSMKQYYKKRGTNVLSIIRKMYRITPARLKMDNSLEISETRNFTLYMLVNYSGKTIEDISNDFSNITEKDLEYMMDNKILEIKYEDKIRNFFDYLKDGYLSNIYQHIAFADDVSFDKIIQSKRL